MSAQRLFEEMQAAGYGGSYGRVRDYVRTVRGARAGGGGLRAGPVKSTRWTLRSRKPGEPRPEQFRVGERAMRYVDDEKTVLIVNNYIRLAGIPSAAHQYQVNGRTPLEWFIDRYKIVQDGKSGIVNDPNAWFDDPRDLIAAIRRIVAVSVETVRIVRELARAFRLH